MNGVLGVMWLILAIIMGCAAIVVGDAVSTVREMRKQNPQSYTFLTEFVGYALILVIIIAIVWNLNISLSYFSK